MANTSIIRQQINSLLPSSNKKEISASRVRSIFNQVVEAIDDSMTWAGQTATPASTPNENINVYTVSTAGVYANYGGVVVTTTDLDDGRVELRKENNVWKKVIIPIDSQIGTKVNALEIDTELLMPIVATWQLVNTNGGVVNPGSGAMTIPNGSSGDGTIMFKELLLTSYPDLAVGDVLHFRYLVSENTAGISDGPKLFNRILVQRGASTIQGAVINGTQTRISASVMQMDFDYTVTAGDTILWPYLSKGGLNNTSGTAWIWTVTRFDFINTTKKVAKNILSETLYGLNKRSAENKNTLAAQAAQLATQVQFQKNHSKVIIGQPSLIQIINNTPTTVQVQLTGVVLVFDEKSGYRTIDPVSIVLGNNEILCLSGSASSYVDPGLYNKGAGSKLFLYKYAFNSQTDTLPGYCELGAVMGYMWTPSHPSFNDRTTISKLLTESTNRDYLNSRFVDLEGKGLLPKRDTRQSSIASKIPRFVEKWRLKAQDVNIVVKDGSISTDMDYSVKRVDEAYRPPCCTERNLTSFIEEKLRWKGQQYRRYDSKTVNGGSTNTFVETGIGETKRLDAAWDWQYTAAQPTQPDYNGLTRVLTGANPAVSYAFPAAHSRCDFIYRTDYVSSNVLTVTVVGGNGLVQVQNDAGVWVEANGFIFSSKEPDVVYPGVSPLALPSSGLRKTIYQKRLNMRRSDTAIDRQITITSADGARLCYWGIQFGKKDVMINVINNARGSHDIQKNRLFEAWDVDYWKPDLILYGCNTINERSTVANPTSTFSPTAFAANFQTYITDLLAKSYQPEMVAYISFCMRGQNLVNAQDVVQSTLVTGYGRATLFDYHDTLFNVLKSLPIGAMNAFHEYYAIAQRRAEFYGTTVYAEMHGATGATSNSFTCDTTHLNEYGEMIRWRLFEPEFNF